MDHKLTREEIEQILDNRAVLIDVRSDRELAEQSCKMALHWDFDQMAQGRFPNIPKDTPVFVFCRVGNRASVAQSLLIKQGFSDVHNIGGISNLPDELCR